MRLEDRLLPIDDVLTIAGISRSMWYRLMAEGRAPRPIKIGTKRAVWRGTEIVAWRDAIANGQEWSASARSD